MRQTRFYICLILIISCILNQTSIAQIEQNRAVKWYFGNNHGFDFTTGQITKLEDSNMRTVESCCTMSDRNGNLLFYTNGGGREDGTGKGYIWNGQHEVMEGGDLGETLGGGYSSYQGCLAVPRPNYPDFYYLFTVDEIETLFIDNSQFPKGKGCSYFEIDMAANKGKGKVTLGKEKLVSPSFEYISGTLHGNCTDYWVIAQTGNHLVEGNANVADSFYVFLVNEEGIQAPIKQPVLKGSPDIRDEYGPIKMSPDGEQLICGLYLYQFDKLTGFLSEPRLLFPAIADPNAPLAFSQNGDLLYNFRLNTFGDTTFIFEAIQYDLSNPTLDSSAIIVGEVPLILKSRGRVGTPQLAPDGKIYVPSWMGKPFNNIVVTTIDFPDKRGEAAIFTYDVEELSEGLDERFLRFGNFMDHIFKEKEENIYTERQIPIRVNCEDQESILLKAPPEKDIYAWSQNSRIDSIEVTKSGKYWVNYATGCDAGTDTFLLTINNSQFDVKLAEDIVFLCENDRYLLSPEPIADVPFQWQDGTFATSFEIEKAGMYSVSAQKGLCVASDSVRAVDLNPPTLNLGEDTIICKGRAIYLSTTFEPYNSYEWQNGLSDTSFIIKEAGTYNLTVFNDCGEVSDEIEIATCPNCELYIPNIFSPNDDGENDLLKAYPNEQCRIINFQMTILDRWGNQKKQLYGLEDSWDGIVAGQRSLEGGYMYVANYTINWQDGRKEDKVQIGDITLIR